MLRVVLSCCVLIAFVCSIFNCDTARRLRKQLTVQVAEIDGRLKMRKPTRTGGIWEGCVRLHMTADSVDILQGDRDK